MRATVCFPTINESKTVVMKYGSVCYYVAYCKSYTDYGKCT